MKKISEEKIKETIEKMERERGPKPLPIKLKARKTVITIPDKAMQDDLLTHVQAIRFGKAGNVAVGTVGGFCVGTGIAIASIGSAFGIFPAGVGAVDLILAAKGIKQERKHERKLLTKSHDIVHKKGFLGLLNEGARKGTVGKQIRMFAKEGYFDLKVTSKGLRITRKEKPSVRDLRKVTILKRPR